jgi:sec-independent protein translocase protein TatB
MFDLGFQEILVVLIVALLVFGPKRLPELARTIGRGMGELKRSLSGVKYEFEREMEESGLDRAARDARADLNKLAAEVREAGRDALERREPKEAAAGEEKEETPHG